MELLLPELLGEVAGHTDVVTASIFRLCSKKHRAALIGAPVRYNMEFGSQTPLQRFLLDTSPTLYEWFFGSNMSGPMPTFPRASNLELNWDGLAGIRWWLAYDNYSWL